MTTREPTLSAVLSALADLPSTHRALLAESIGMALACMPDNQHFLVMPYSLLWAVLRGEGAVRIGEIGEREQERAEAARDQAEHVARLEKLLDRIAATLDRETFEGDTSAMDALEEIEGPIYEYRQLRGDGAPDQEGERS